jgi:hypothetical protein
MATNILFSTAYGFRPILSPPIGLLLFVLAPLFIFGVTLLFRMRRLQYGSIFRFLDNLKKYALLLTIDRAWLLFGINFLISLLLCCNFAAYALHHLQLGLDISYYLKINLVAYDAIGAINQASSSSSFSSVAFSSTTRRRLEDIRSNAASKSSTSSSAVALVYHEQSWGNIYTESSLQNICLVEKSIREQMTCFDITSGYSIMPKLFDISTCDYLTSYDDALYQLSLAENALFVQDQAGSSKGSILLSYVRLGHCVALYPRVAQLTSAIRSSASKDSSSGSDVGSITVTVITPTYLKKEFVDATLNAILVSAEVSGRLDVALLS